MHLGVLMCIYKLPSFRFEERSIDLSINSCEFSRFSCLPFDTTRSLAGKQVTTYNMPTSNELRTSFSATLATEGWTAHARLLVPGKTVGAHRSCPAATRE